SALCISYFRLLSPPFCLACANCGCSPDRRATSATSMRGSCGACGHMIARERSGAPPGLANGTAPTNASIQKPLRIEPYQNPSRAFCENHVRTNWRCKPDKCWPDVNHIYAPSEV